MKSKPAKTKTDVTPNEEEDSLERLLAEGGQLCPTEEDIAKWTPRKRLLLGADFYANSDHLPQGDELERAKERSKRVHSEALERVRALTESLAKTLEELRLAAVIALSGEVKQIAQEALADLYVEIGKEYARATQKKKGPRLHSNLEDLLKEPAFKKRFDYRKSMQNHERLSLSPVMAIINDAVGSALEPSAVLSVDSLHSDRHSAESLWESSILPVIKSRWETMKRRYLKDQKRKSIGYWEGQLKKAWRVYWNESQMRQVEEPERLFPEENFRVRVARAREMFRCALGQHEESGE